MRKYLLILLAALIASAFSGCKDDAAFPFIPVDKPGTTTPPEGNDPTPHRVTYRLDKVLLCSPENAAGVNIINKFDFFASMRMTLSVSPTQTTLLFDNGDIPFYPLSEALPEGEILCELDASVSPNVLRIQDSDTVIATFEKDGFTISFQLDCKSLTYKYKFKSLN